ncbi:MAG TPA: 3',5'-cyclic nucleotide phosphodiesterase, partial [bacterium]
INRQFRVFGVRTKSKLVDCVMDILTREGSVSIVGADTRRLKRFVEEIAKLYHGNPYHNFHHAVDVTNTIAWMLTRHVFSQLLTANQAFWLLITAITHDVDHPGRNNQWEVYTHSPLAEKYGTSILERHSLDLTRALMAQPEMQFHATMSARDVEEGLKLLEDSILATDFAMHRDFLTTFVSALKEEPGAIRNGTPEFQVLVCKALIKAADIANTTRPYPQARVWGHRVMKEFWAQGELEKENSFPVGPLNDPTKVNMNQAQAGFIKFAAMELYELLAKLDPEMNELVGALKDNVHQYEAAEQRARSSLKE